MLSNYTMESGSDTIFALATPLPPIQGSGIAIVRLSGPNAFPIASRLVGSGIEPGEIPDREFKIAVLTHGGKEIDHSGILAFHSPHSYTGEDVIEFHLHGGLAVIRALERALIDLDARPAQPGEFTRRAFLNGRMDLLQAESVASLIGASGETARREALRQRSGALSGKIQSVRSRLRDILARLEVDFDYPEERVDRIDTAEAIGSLDPIVSELGTLLDSWKTGRILGGFRLAIIGLPNVGKSSLLNALLREDRAIVTAFPGTTRDVVSGTLSFGGVPAEILDTAGIRLLAEDVDPIDAEGIMRSWREVERAHLILIVFDTSIPLDRENIDLVRKTLQIVEGLDGSRAIVLLVSNKIDLAGAWNPSGIAALVDSQGLPHVSISAKTGEGIENLRANVRELLNLEVSPDEILLTDSRHLSLVNEAHEILEEARLGLSHAIPQDIAATELWGADRALGRLLGEGIGAADLDDIFSRFCVGK